MGIFTYIMYFIYKIYYKINIEIFTIMRKRGGKMRTLVFELIGIMTTILILYIVTVIGIRRDKKSYNNGICPKCGAPLERFDSDGEHIGYHCKRCTYIAWISWASREYIDDYDDYDDGYDDDDL